MICARFLRQKSVFLIKRPLKVFFANPIICVECGRIVIGGGNRVCEEPVGIFPDGV